MGRKIAVIVWEGMMAESGAALGPADQGFC